MHKKKYIILLLFIVIIISIGYIFKNYMSARQGARLFIRINSINWEDENELDQLINEIQPKHLSFLNQCLKVNDPVQQMRVAYVLARYGRKEYITYLESGLKSQNPGIEKTASSLLWSLWFSEGGIDSREILHECQVLVNQKKFDDAIAKLTKLTRRKPAFAEAYNQRAIAFYNKGDYQRSVSDCLQVLELNPNHFGAQSGLGMCYMNIGEYFKAKEAFEKSLLLTPHTINTRMLLRKVDKILQEQQKNIV